MSTNNTTNAGDEIGPVMSWLDEMIANAETEKQEASPEKQSVTITRNTQSPTWMRQADGWAKRATDPKDEPTGDGWLAAFQHARKTIAAGGILVLHGDRGNGKTRMAEELARLGEFPTTHRIVPGTFTATKREPEKRAIYRTAIELFLEVRATFREGSSRTELDVIREMGAPGLLVVDEMQERAHSNWEDRVITEVVDLRHRNWLPTILIANLSKQDFSDRAGPSIIDRVNERGRRIEFTWPSFRRLKRTTNDQQ